MDDLKQAESQLADVEELLKASPDDDSLKSLKDDLLELIRITKESLGGETGTEPDDTGETADKFSSLPAPTDFSALADLSSAKRSVETETPSTEEPPKKKKKKLKDFAVPEHLIPLETDSDAVKTKKRRAIKALKTKHRHEKKTREANNKQKSWQSFQKKKGSSSSKSIFSTTDSKVGVSGSGRKMTEFGERKRHK